MIEATVVDGVEVQNTREELRQHLRDCATLDGRRPQRRRPRRMMQTVTAYCFAAEMLRRNIIRRGP